MDFFYIILYQPLFNFLILLYTYLPGRDFGIAILSLTIFFRLLFYPLGIKAIQSQKLLQELQPQIKEIQQKHKNNKEKQAKETMELYKKAKINPFSSLLPILIQLPILIALYQVFLAGFQAESMVHLYRFVPNPGQIEPFFLGTIDLSKPATGQLNGQTIFLLPNIILVILNGIAQFFQTKTLSPKTSEVKKDREGRISEKIQNQMGYFLPIFTIFILWNLPAAIALYWLITTVFSVIQQYFVLHPDSGLIKNFTKKYF